MAARPCRATRCPNLVKSKAEQGFCDDHASQRGAWVRERRAGSTTSRGYGAAWQRLRASILKRDHYICQCSVCSGLGRVREATEVDHIVGKASGGTDDPGNLQAINHDCHKEKTARESNRRE